MDRVLAMTVRVMTATMLVAFAIGGSVEAFATWGGAWAFPTPGHDVPVRFHAVPIYVTSTQALLYHAAVATFIGCWIVGVLCAVAKASTTRDYRRH